jgi:hypothetical protein
MQVFLLSCPGSLQLYRIESLHLPGLTVTAGLDESDSRVCSVGSGDKSVVTNMA